MMWKIVFTILTTVFAVGLGGLVGGFSDADINDERVRDALNFAVVQHNKGNNDMYLSQVAEVVSAKKQVVGGMKYLITVRMGKTPCRKNSTNEVCAIHENPEMSRPYTCVFTVYTRPWEGYISLLNEEC